MSEDHVSYELKGCTGMSKPKEKTAKKWPMPSKEWCFCIVDCSKGHVTYMLGRKVKEDVKLWYSCR